MSGSEREIEKGGREGNRERRKEGGGGREGGVELKKLKSQRKEE